MKGFQSESEYRAVMKETLDRVEKAFDAVDPDVAECSVQFGALTILFPDGSRCILSSQPSVGQLWMAVASRGIAFHFDYDPQVRVWKDDKGQGIELFAYLQQFIRETTGLSIAL